MASQHPSRRLALSAAGALAVATAMAVAPRTGTAQPAAAAPAPGEAQAGGACPPLLQHSFERLQDEKPQSLCQYAGQVVLVVNTASFCGFTRQYKALEDLHKRYQGRGLVVLGFPSNDFSQEPGDNQTIAEFCENTFGVRFPMFSKSAVRGADANPLFKQLAQLSGQAPKWNFHKYLIARDGQTVSSYASAVNPRDAALVRQIEQFLAAR
jgi:glutathione peroxidase